MTTPSASKAASSSFLLAMADHATTLGALVSLHTADPQDTGLAEVSGGAYSRQTTTWSPAVLVGGLASAQGSDCSFSVPAGVVCTHFGVWGASGFLYGAVLTPPVSGGLAIVSPRYEEVPDAAGAAAPTTGPAATTLVGGGTTVVGSSGVDGGTP